MLDSDEAVDLCHYIDASTLLKLSIQATLPYPPSKPHIHVLDTGLQLRAKLNHDLLSCSDKKLKPCCACPETKNPRDACIVENGEDNCHDLIEAHKDCMRKLGFKI